MCVQTGISKQRNIRQKKPYGENKHRGEGIFCSRGFAGAMSFLLLQTLFNPSSLGSDWSFWDDLQFSSKPKVAYNPCRRI